ncbi:mannosyl-oligosaccharide 1,2-alpha-mannosidase IB isoform X3 [Octopus bimaculoides]|uniref:mannosyl-oligosaccharide 1,2-alpha-mannosidase IB isoform X3 n=1 Tax=Octopus bimaculoides TaxID=37653 RepID=UPI0022E1D4DC|nr:mannosyl-oligosaccharide 1,2-alpha-mannosidase IB isoform X3 [Octopus bimaculoides]
MFSFSDVVAWTHKMAASGILPTYQRYINGVPIPNTRRILRFREKYIVLLVFAIFVTVCFGGFFFLPELRDRVNVDTLARGAQQMFLPEPFGGTHGNGHKHGHSRQNSLHQINSNNNNKGDLTQGNSSHTGNQQQQQQLKNDGLSAGVKVKLEERLNISKDTAAEYKKLINLDKNKLQEKIKKAKIEQDKRLKENVVFEHEGGYGVRGGEPDDPVYKVRREKVKEATSHDEEVWPPRALCRCHVKIKHAGVA